MSQTAEVLLVSAAILLGLGLFALGHRRDALGALLALLLGFNAVVCALVGFSGLAATRSGAAQLQAYAVVVELTGVLFAAAGISMAAVLRRRSGGSDLLEAARVVPSSEGEPGASRFGRRDPGEAPAMEPEPEPELDPGAEPEEPTESKSAAEA